MARIAKLKNYFFTSLVSYESPKLVQIDSKCIGLTHNILLVTLTVAVVVYVFLLNNGYQYIDERARVSTTCKIKGVTYSNSTDPRLGKRIWDTADLYSHPVGDGSFFITTNLITSRHQQQGVCAEQDGVAADCEQDADCKEGKSFLLGHGVSTGKCNTTTGTCMVYAWCPIEDDTLPNQQTIADLKDTKNFTVYIKDHVYFPYYNTTRSNLIESITTEYLRSCRYHPQTDPYCPIFRVGDIVSIAMEQSDDRDHPVKINDRHFESMAIKGGVISITILWDCNLDYSPSECKPKYEFSRLDDYGGNDIAPGYNFRYSYNFDEQETATRHLFKAYGILFLVKNEAIARAFHLRTFLVNLGSSLALLGLAPFTAEFVLLYIHKNRRLFKKHKFEPTKGIHELLKKTSQLQIHALSEPKDDFAQQNGGKTWHI